MGPLVCFTQPMPYKIVRQGSQHCVVNAETGDKRGCHKTRAQALAQMRALYVHVPDARKDIELEDLMDEETQPDISDDFATVKALYATDGSDEKCGIMAEMPMPGPTSFDEADQMEQAAEQADEIWSLNRLFTSIVGNIVHSMDIEDKTAALASVVDDYGKRLRDLSSATLDEMKSAIGFKKAQVKQENGMDFYAKDYAYVPNPDLPSTWKLRLSEAPGKVTIAQLGRAAAALSPGGFRGNRVSIPASALSAIKRRIRYEYQKLGVPPAKIPPAVREDTTKDGLMLWKDGEVYRWLAIYSNHFRDDDYPAEILSEKAHLAFHGAVEAGFFDYPELWHWHKTGTRFGKADHLSYADGFALAAGTIDKGHEAEADALMSVPFELGVSHGMPLKWIVRNEEDPTVIDFYASVEISVLPKEAAANKHTGFVVLTQETGDMPLTDKQREYFKLVNFTDDQIAALEKNLQDAGDLAAQVEGRESKNASETPPVPQTDEVKETPVAVTPEMIAEAISSVVGPMVQVMTTLNERIGSMESQLKELQVEETTRIAKTAEASPRASITELIHQRVFGQQEAKVEKDSVLAQQGPKETEPPQEPVTGIPWLDTIVRGGSAQ